MLKIKKIVDLTEEKPWIARPFDLRERECPSCKSNAVRCKGILTDVVYDQRKCLDCGHFWNTG